MARRPVLRFAALLFALAFLLPLAAGGGSCADCLWADPPDCCPPSCCPCCEHGPSVLTVSIGGAPHAGTADMAPGSREDRYPSSPPRDIFHVPKPSLT
jgi:hypothetical protein